LPPTTGKLTSEPIAKARLVFPAFAELTKIEGKKTGKPVFTHGCEKRVKYQAAQLCGASYAQNHHWSIGLSDLCRCLG